MTEAATERSRSPLWNVLDHAVLWEGTRLILDATFGLYRRRVALLRGWGLLGPETSVLDVGCGIGQYANVAGSRYLGVDLNERYIAHARRRRGGPGREFRAEDVTKIGEERGPFDLVLMVDFLHHLSDELCLDLLRAAARLSTGHVVNFEPVLEQSNRAGRWIIDNDRGDHMRPLAEVEALFEPSGLEIVRSEPLSLGPIGTRAILSAPAAS